MNRTNEFKGFNMLADEDSDMISFVSGSMSSVSAFRMTGRVPARQEMRRRRRKNPSFSHCS